MGAGADSDTSPKTVVQTMAWADKAVAQTADWAVAQAMTQTIDQAVARTVAQTVAQTAD